MDRIAIIGRGMIGSAAARHLAGMTDGIVLVGPDEPDEYAAHEGVFASHYDEGRMTRISDADPAWSITAKRSIERYGEIEAESGIRFFTKSGYLGISTAGSDYLDRAKETGLKHGADLTSLDADGIRGRYPFLSVADGTRGLQEVGDAGHVSPRAMVAAQTEAARRRGAEIVQRQVAALRPVPGGVEIETDDGSVRQAERVLVATGGFTDACGLSPEDLKLRVFGRTVLLARIEGALTEHFAAMPTMGHAESGAYLLPPIRYPDGHSYMKIGIGSVEDPALRTLEDMSNWFKSDGIEENRTRFRSFLLDLMPRLVECRSWQSKSCAVTWTATGLPYIDFVQDDRIAVAVGGNGKGAKSSDDWGWIAAHVVSGTEFEHPVGRDRLRIPAR
ncbi:FAD-dependent oxidoreductase [Nisaea acidiphila]|uniref:FAD-dependent oxidoreductase n=1 Tax=Nisaea acidiphila TaxID=1862145 RepID=A0A9J7ATN9_9PROT|nr:FAD-dependent oxidoreductase [Nisaea acidiphila]UUX50712.1 FAD-dependent oxidoreductase [Nisaea acidiphila]